MGGDSEALDGPVRAEPDTLLTQSRLPAPELLRQLGTTAQGLDSKEAAVRLQRYGPNAVSGQRRLTILQEIVGRARNPLNALLLVLAIVSWLTGDARAAVVIAVMVALSVLLAFVQEHRSSRAAEALRSFVKTRASVLRPGRGADDGGRTEEIPIENLVPGDIVELSAGDLVPADIRVLTAKDLHVNESALTGEAMPVEKHESIPLEHVTQALEAPNLSFMGSNVLSGTAACVVLRTGVATYFGQLARRVTETRGETSFDRGVARFTWLMVRFIAVMVPAVFLINGITKGNWLEALLFAVAVGVGLTPEMLPMIVTMNLAKGALALARKRVIVKRLDAIQNFGAMDVLCTDKTGTLTQDRIILQYHLGLDNQESPRVLELAWLNSHFQSGLRNLLDEAVLKHAEQPEHRAIHAVHAKVDEMPFDFQRRRMSVVLGRRDGGHLLICKGAVEEVLAVCAFCEMDGAVTPLDPSHLERAQSEMTALNGQGFRVVAVAYKAISEPHAAYSVTDECDLTLAGFIAFLDPPKDTVAAALRALHRDGIAVKVLTGDNEVITRTICRQVGLRIDKLLLGAEVEQMPDEQLGDAAEQATVFAKMSPAQKARVVDALHRRGHVVGFLGDGINDGAALKAADVGVSVDSAVDIARESADIILLEKSLTILHDGVVEGRRIFGNIVKYMKMGASSNFGNMFSVLGASIFLPFLPMAPIQVLTNNLLYDFSQTAIPTDTVDEEYIAAPRAWDIGNLTRFMLFIGPISSLFDYATFAVMLFVFNSWDNPPLFQTGWFVESLLTQTLIIHIIRTARIPFFESRASTPLILTTILICMIAAMLPFSPVGPSLGFVRLPPLYWPFVAAMLVGYAALTHLVKVWFIRRWGM